jgi:hypothetical protein
LEAITSIGMSRRSAAKLECISALIERARARSARSVGHRLRAGYSSWRYSPIASESQITRPSWWRTGTRPAGVTAAISAAVVGVSSTMVLHSNGAPVCTTAR